MKYYHLFVIAGLVPVIHAVEVAKFSTHHTRAVRILPSQSGSTAWMAGTSPAMTEFI